MPVILGAGQITHEETLGSTKMNRKKKAAFWITKNKRVLRKNNATKQKQMIKKKQPSLIEKRFQLPLFLPDVKFGECYKICI